MANPIKNEKKIREIKIGIYGNSGAGKTRFLYKLLQDWENQKLILGKSNEAYDLIKHADNQIAKGGTVDPTKGITDGISVDVRFEDKNSNDTRYIFSDLLGEILATELDKLVENKRPITKTDEQIKECHGYFFFFNPIGSGNETNLEKHFNDEANRANKLITFITETRQNDFLPIIFIVTHLDKIKDNPQILLKTKSWLSGIISEYIDSLEKRFRGILPKMSMNGAYYKAMVSSVSGENINLPFHNLNKLLLPKKEVGQGLKVLLMVAMLFIFLFGCIFVSLKCNERSIDLTSQMIEDFNKNIKLLEESTTFKDKIKIINNLNPNLPNLIEISRAKNPVVGKDSVEKIKEKLNLSTQLIQKLVNEYTDLEDKKNILGAYLANLPRYSDLPDNLMKLSDEYWLFVENNIILNSKKFLNECRMQGGNVSDCPIKIGEFLKKQKEEIDKNLIPYGNNRDNLLQELTKASEFLLKSDQFYKTKFTVIKAELLSESANANIVLKVRYTDKEDYYISLIKSPESPMSRRTKEDSYDVIFKVSPAVPVIDLFESKGNDNKWINYTKLNLTTEDEIKKSPLGPLGIVLAFEDQKERILRIKNKEIDITLKIICDFSNIPPFILRLGGIINVDKK